MTKHLFILNPAAGKRDGTAALRQVIEELGSARGLDYRVELTRQAGHAEALAREAAASGDELRIYACGGDGTLNEVVNGAAGRMNAAVTHVPCGSGNDFVKLFSDPSAFSDLGRLMDPEEACFDVVRVNDRLSLGVCSAGLDARIAADMAHYKRLPLVTGSGAYVMSIAVNLLRGVREHCRVEIGDEVYDGTCTLACVCNGRWYGGGYCPVPEADPTDGVLDVLVVKGVSLIRALQIIGKYKVGRYAEYPDTILHYRCRELTLRADREIPVNMDGEIVRTDSVRFAVEPGQMRFFYPRGLTWRAEN